MEHFSVKLGNSFQRNDQVLLMERELSSVRHPFLPSSDWFADKL